MAVSTRTRRAISTVLALVLAVETVTAVAAAAATRTVTHPLPADPPAGAVLGAGSAGEQATSREVVVVAPASAEAIPASPDVPDHAAPVGVRPEPAAPARPVVKARTTPRANDAARLAAGDRLFAAPTGSGDGSPRAARVTAYKGRNHVWIPELGISRSVAWFPCDRQRPPDNLMYRWGCAGANNVYLMGHAYSVMEPLHDAYVSGRLHKGMKAWYADGNGRVQAYAVVWWKKTLPTTDAAWAWAAQSKPSMTLQTCVGKNSKYRLMVRLVRVAG